MYSGLILQAEVQAATPFLPLQQWSTMDHYVDTRLSWGTEYGILFWNADNHSCILDLPVKLVS